MMNETTLGDLIDFLKTLPPDAVIKDGFSTPHSDRGSYNELAFTPEENATASDMLSYAESAVNASFEGWKGGDYLMDRNTPVYIGDFGRCGEPITPTHFKYWKLLIAVAEGETL